MSKKPTRTLVIVESPAKCSKIEEMLGPAYVVRASYGHIRDIVDGLKAIDFKNQYAITYGMIDNELKRKKIAELKTLKQQCGQVLIASDPDREGEAIAYHVAVVLGLPIPSAKRIKFQEITKRAILAAVASPGIINMELVRSQEARRVLDLLVGFEISPILSRTLGGNLSAGRCQSPAVRLVYDREKEIERQETTTSFTIDVVLTAEATSAQKVPLAHINATFKKRYLVRSDVEQRFELIQLPGTIFTIDSFTKKPVEHSPPKPYTTSTIQQDCSSLLSMNPKETMSILQKLYEAGKTTYMRTDSVILSHDAMNEIGLEIRNKYDVLFHTPREYKNKGAASQEAHEAIRPTHMTEYPLQSNVTHKEEWSVRESRVYELVWRRTMSSQMTNQRIQRNSAEISMIINSPKKTIHDDKLESIIDIEEFPGWKILYGSGSESKSITEPDGVIVNTNMVEAIQSLLKSALICIQAEGTQSYSRSLCRYTEASLIKDLESQGIGRPSTYANIMETIIKERKYVDVRDFPGIEKPTETLILKRKSAILTFEVKSGKTILGKEKNKLVISPLGYKIVEFLMKEFNAIMDYDFTKLVEEELDLIIEKKANYSSVVDKVYTTFHPRVLELRGASTSNHNQQSDAVVLGTYDEHEVILKNGKFGYYLVYNGENFGIGYSTPERKQKIVDEHDIDEAVVLIDSTIESRKKRETNPVIKVPPKGAFEIRLGPYGYYFTHNKKFYSIGKREPGSLTEKDCRDIIKDKYKMMDK